tara:strand:+ start:536 stop:841 length:306 start_codon:yes stop_codon:yes gene_type:complete
MSFNNFQKKNLDSSNKNISKVIFKEALTLINKTWDRWDSDITKLKNDIQTLDRMFNDYGKDKRYIELKEVIMNTISIKKNNLNQLEKLVLGVKTTIESSGH